jgi:TonB family protein
MSHETPKSDTPRTHTIKPKPAKGSAGDGQWKKWAAGGAAAVVLLGGGYFLVKNLNNTDSRTEIAYNESIPLDEATTSADESAPNSESDTVETASESARPAAAPPRRRQAASAAADSEVPEQVVGVTSVSATTSDEDEIVVPGIRGPQWSRTPSARRLSAAYPERALERGREGEASVRCTVEQSGSLDCVRVSETPANAGFGTAALRVARMYRHAPERWNGSSAVGTPVNLRVMFRMAEDDQRRRS